MSRRMCRMAVWMQTAPHPRECTTPYAGMPGHGKHPIPAYIERARGHFCFWPGRGLPQRDALPALLREGGMEGTRRERGEREIMCLLH